MKFPFEVPFEEVEANPDAFVSAIFDSLESEFLVLPKGPGFVEYPAFERGYEALKQATAGFTDLSPDALLRAVTEVPIALVVLRTMLGFTPPEWAYVTSQHSGVSVNQGFARSLDRDVRMASMGPRRSTGLAGQRIKALVTIASRLLQAGTPAVGEGKIHRLDKADTPARCPKHPHPRRSGRSLCDAYERFLGRPFAGHRDSVSELVGDGLEIAIENILTDAAISYRKTKRAERIPGFDQAPDFIVPDEFSPQVIIEAKITEDDGTARDKVTRIQHLGELSMAGQPPGQPRYEVVACIAGRGFGVRREDMKKLLLGTRGKVFTLQNLERLVECTRLAEFRTR